MTATVAQLWRYPVKSLAGEQLSAVHLTPDGLAGDRAYALIDLTTGKVLSAKKEPRLLQGAAWTTDEGEVVVGVPEIGEFNVDDGRLDVALCDWLNRPVASARIPGRLCRPIGHATPVVTKQPGTFYDSPSTLHVLTTSSLEAMAHIHPESTWDVRRFRPNLLVSTTDAGFVEDAWVTRTVSCGSARILVREQTIRCTMPSRRQQDLPEDPDILRVLATRRDNRLGVRAIATNEARLDVGLHVQPWEP